MKSNQWQRPSGKFIGHYCFAKVYIVESNKFEPCKLFETSCSRLKEKNSEVLVPGSLSTVAPEMTLVDQIFTNVPSALDAQLFTDDQLKLVEGSVLITVDEVKEIC